jgi:hypothetical protein
MCFGVRCSLSYCIITGPTSRHKAGKNTDDGFGTAVGVGVGMGVEVGVGVNVGMGVPELKILNARPTSAAGLYNSLPNCDALIMHVPAFINDTVLPLTEQISADNELNVTGNPDDAIAEI